MKTAVLSLALASTALGQSLSEALNSTGLTLLPTLLNEELSSQLVGSGNITLLAPNDDAINAFLNTSLGMQASQNPDLVSAVLSYHVLQGNMSNFTNTSFIPTMLMEGDFANVPGGQVVQALGGENVTFFSGLLQNASVVNASIPFDGGVIHVIDSLLTLPQNLSATAVALNLTSAVGALQNLSLVQPLSEQSGLTYFIPNNAAFQRIGGNLANLSSEELTSIFQYHVVPSVVYSTDLMNGTSVGTLMEGDMAANLTVTLDGGDVFVNSARVIRPNVLVSNGVIHVIDRVLNPGNATATPNTATTEEAFEGATSAAEEPFTSGVPTPTSAIETEAVASAEESATGSEGGALRAIETGAIGMAALFGGAAAMLNM